MVGGRGRTAALPTWGEGGWDPHPLMGGRRRDQTTLDHIYIIYIERERERWREREGYIHLHIYMDIDVDGHTIQSLC